MLRFPLLPASESSRALLPSVLLSLALLSSSAACAPVEQAEIDPYADSSQADRARFVPQRLVSDRVFANGRAFDAAKIGEMLRATPWGASFLAEHKENDRPARELIAAAARTHSVNPLVLLALLQTQRGLLSEGDDPGARRITGGLCPGKDGETLEGQLDCAAEILAEAYRAGTELEPTVSGRHIDETFTTVDGIRVTPANRAALAIYTYAPTYGAAELFFQVFRQLAEHYEYEDGLVLPYNEGYIGGDCRDADDCLYAGAACTEIDARKVCTLPCDRTCPDRVAPGFAQTFCIESSAAPSGRGLCVAKCDDRQSSTSCGEGFACERGVARFSQPSRTADVCLPKDGGRTAPGPTEPTDGEPAVSTEELTFLLTLSNIDDRVEANLLASTQNSITLFGVEAGLDRYEIEVMPADDGEAWSEYGPLVVPTFSFVDTEGGMIPVELTSVGPAGGRSVAVSGSPLAVEELSRIQTRGQDAEVGAVLKRFALGDHPDVAALFGDDEPLMRADGKGRFTRALPGDADALALFLNLSYSTPLIDHGRGLLDKGENLTVELPVRVVARCYGKDGRTPSRCLYEY